MPTLPHLRDDAPTVTVLASAPMTLPPSPPTADTIDDAPQVTATMLAPGALPPSPPAPPSPMGGPPPGTPGPALVSPNGNAGGSASHMQVWIFIAAAAILLLFFTLLFLLLLFLLRRRRRSHSKPEYALPLSPAYDSLTSLHPRNSLLASPTKARVRPTVFISASMAIPTIALIPPSPAKSVFPTTGDGEEQYEMARVEEMQRPPVHLVAVRRLSTPLPAVEQQQRGRNEYAIEAPVGPMSQPSVLVRSPPAVSSPSQRSPPGAPTQPAPDRPPSRVSQHSPFDASPPDRASAQADSDDGTFEQNWYGYEDYIDFADELDGQGGSEVKARGGDVHDVNDVETGHSIASPAPDHEADDEGGEQSTRSSGASLSTRPTSEVNLRLWELASSQFALDSSSSLHKHTPAASSSPGGPVPPTVQAILPAGTFVTDERHDSGSTMRLSVADEEWQRMISEESSWGFLSGVDWEGREPVERHESLSETTGSRERAEDDEDAEQDPNLHAQAAVVHPLVVVKKPITTNLADIARSISQDSFPSNVSDDEQEEEEEEVEDQRDGDGDDDDETEAEEGREVRNLQTPPVPELDLDEFSWSWEGEAPSASSDRDFVLPSPEPLNAFPIEHSKSTASSTPPPSRIPRPTRRTPSPVPSAASVAHAGHVWTPKTKVDGVRDPFGACESNVSGLTAHDVLEYSRIPEPCIARQGHASPGTFKNDRTRYTPSLRCRSATPSSISRPKSHATRARSRSPASPAIDLSTRRFRRHAI